MKVSDRTLAIELNSRGYEGNNAQITEVKDCLDELQSADFNTTYEAVSYAINECHWELNALQGRGFNGRL